MKKFKIQLGKTSWGHLRLGSWVSVTAILVAFVTSHIADVMGTRDALWVEIIKWVALGIFTGDIFYSLCKRSPRKRWEAVMTIGLTLGCALLLGALAIYLKSGYEPFIAQLITVGGFILLIMGVGGFILWRVELRRLNTRILERTLKRKKRNYGV
ncbi:MAG: hypothetical protein E7137_02515 [Rikenellaceae bacterium]|nr:hypothetical protein [Rikenellaceae bacterium]